MIIPSLSSEMVQLLPENVMQNFRKNIKKIKS